MKYGDLPHRKLLDLKIRDAQEAFDGSIRFQDFTGALIVLSGLEDLLAEREEVKRVDSAEGDFDLPEGTRLDSYIEYLDFA